MIANLLNTILGVALVYVAILKPGLVNGRSWFLAVAAIAVIILAALARSSDRSTWQSSTNSVIGFLLLALAVARWYFLVPELLIFWSVLWGGLLVAILALWAAIYHPAGQN